MNLIILDKERNATHILDSYESLIWADRYSECGDFEIYTTVTDELLKFAQRDYYIVSPESDHVMIIETIHINTDAEDGNHIKLQGNSLEKILERRIIWGYKEVSGTPEEVIETLLNECIINPTYTNDAGETVPWDNRRIDGFRFDKSDDPRITGLEAINAVYMGDNLYTVIVNICNTHELGFRITFDDETGEFVFKLYKGADRSYNQTENPYVIFSPSFDNLVNTNYMETRSALKTVALVAGFGMNDASRTTHEVDTMEMTGADRRELFVDARDILTDSDNSQKTQRGKEKLAEYTDISSFEGQAETRIMFKYGEDFFTGDIVQFADEYGHEAPARIVEMITSDSGEGLSVYPTFKMIQTNSETEGE